MRFAGGILRFKLILLGLSTSVFAAAAGIATDFLETCSAPVSAVTAPLEASITVMVWPS